MFTYRVKLTPTILTPAPETDGGVIAKPAKMSSAERNQRRADRSTQKLFRDGMPWKNPRKLRHKRKLDATGHDIKNNSVTVVNIGDIDD